MGHPNDTHLTDMFESELHDESAERRAARKMARRKGGRMGHRHFSPHSRGHGGGRHRAKRGAIVNAVLVLLDERPMHGYELITELAERSGGRWEPSAGTMYPALNRMEERGLVEAEEVDGKRRFTLTDNGRHRLEEFKSAREDDEGEPWDDPGTGRRGDLRGKVAELVGQVRQIGRFGTPEQAEQAGAVLDDAKQRLYAILAAGAAPEADQPDVDTDVDAD